MASKKKEVALAKQSTSAALAKPMEDWEIELAGQAKDEASKETLGMQRISHKNGILKIDGQPVKDNKLRCAIVDYSFSKAFYPGAYDPNVAATPTCYAFGREEKGMVPHEQAPKKECADCASCEWNRFGTAERGRGKRCKDERRVMVIVEAQDPDSIAAAETRQINIPPGSLKNWGAYLNVIKEVTPSGNVRAVLTEISTEPSGGAYALTFKPVDRLAKEFVMAILAKKPGVEAALFAPYPNIEQEEKPAPRKGKAKY